MKNSSNNAVTKISQAGKPLTSIEATFSPQFLALLSEHLYSSPNKAFEELISNSWDADATEVYVRIPIDLVEPATAIWILDNGRSMDVEGFAQLWSIAKSSKRQHQESSNRKQIGKFGIGKLATYVLCHELTYICKSDDGVIRIVTMDYRKIENAKSQHLDKLPLTVRVITDLQELESILSFYEGGEEIFTLIKNGIPPVGKKGMSQDEFGGPDVKNTRSQETWTIAILTSLKKEGQSLQIGWIKRLLSTALPLGSSISIQVNNTVIESSKSDSPIHRSWKMGPDLEFDDFLTEDGKTIQIQKVQTPYPHIILEGVGEITGTATLYESNIRGGKSDKIGDSNGFFVNVLGRVINADDHLFKMTDFNLSVLSQFRVAIRVDGLDKQLSANREAVADSDELRIVKGLLRKLFNQARREFGKLEDLRFAELGDGKKGILGSAPLAPLSLLIQRSFDAEEQFPEFVHLKNEADFLREKEIWMTETRDDLSNSLSAVEFRDDVPQNTLVKYDLSTRTIVINKNHPFAKENTQTNEQINTLKDAALVDLLTDAYMLNTGISADVYSDIVHHRDRVMRLVAQIRRNSAANIISTLHEWSKSAKPFEQIVGDALEYLGYIVERYGDPGEPEGVATAHISPRIDDQISVYTFTYDAKSTKHKKAKTGNLNIAGLARHRDDYTANYSLVVAPDYQDGALGKEAIANKITPITAAALAKLVSITVGYGPISLVKLEEIFKIYDPTGVDEWIEQLENETSKKSFVDLKILVKALESLVTNKRMDILGCDAIAQKYREIINSESKPTRMDMAQVFRGLSLVVPNAIFIDPSKGFDVFVLTHPTRIVQEIKRQTQDIPDELKMGSIRAN